MLLSVGLGYDQVVKGSIRCSSVMFGGLFCTVTGPVHASNCFHELENKSLFSAVMPLYTAAAEFAFCAVQNGIRSLLRICCSKLFGRLSLNTIKMLQ